MPPVAESKEQYARERAQLVLGPRWAVAVAEQGNETLREHSNPTAPVPFHPVPHAGKLCRHATACTPGGAAPCARTNAFCNSNAGPIRCHACNTGYTCAATTGGGCCQCTGGTITVTHTVGCSPDSSAARLRSKQPVLSAAVVRRKLLQQHAHASSAEDCPQDSPVLLATTCILL